MAKKQSRKAAAAARQRGRDAAGIPAYRKGGPHKKKSSKGGSSGH